LVLVASSRGFQARSSGNAVAVTGAPGRVGRCHGPQAQQKGPHTVGLRRSATPGPCRRGPVVGVQVSERRDPPGLGLAGGPGEAASRPRGGTRPARLPVDLASLRRWHAAAPRPLPARGQHPAPRSPRLSVLRLAVRAGLRRRPPGLGGSGVVGQPRRTGRGPASISGTVAPACEPTRNLTPPPPPRSGRGLLAGVVPGQGATKCSSLPASESRGFHWQQESWQGSSLKVVHPTRSLPGPVTSRTPRCSAKGPGPCAVDVVA
jgi:hypothetical protein